MKQIDSCPCTRTTNTTPRTSTGFRLGRKKIYILPTRHGLAFAGLLSVMLAGAINYNNSLAYGLTFLLTSVALMSMFHTYRNLAGLEVTGRAADDVFAGSQAYFQINIDNLQGPDRQGIVLRSQTPRSDRVVNVKIPAHSNANALYPLTAAKRGREFLDTLTIASRAPFGLFRAWSPVPLKLPVLVYPAPAGTQPLPSGASLRRNEQGRKSAGRDDFAALREYRPGDSPKQIHWKLAARGDTLPVKLFAGASAGELVLRLADIVVASREAQLSQLCAWVLEAEKRGLHYGLDLGEVCIAAGFGAQHRQQCLRQLALFPDDSAHS